MRREVMSKKIVALVIAAAFTVGFAGVTLAAKKVKCEVKSVEGNTVILTCDSAGALKSGQKVTVADATKKAVEGC
jgi:ABC-type transporter Mla subunit MlaD